MNDEYNAFISTRPAKDGIKLAVKDNILVKGMKATASSRVLEDYIAPYSATVVKRLEESGYDVVGKTHCDEFGCGGMGVYSSLGQPKNPIDIKRVPGGSSSGSAVAVASGLVDVALGSDTGGSIRAPAAWCQVYGYRPSYGLVSRYGLMDMAMSFDTIGFLAKKPEMITKMMEIAAGPDEKDQTTGETFEKKDSYGKRFGVLKTVENSIDKEILEKRDKFIEKLDGEIVEIEIPSLKYAVPAYYMIMFAELSSAMQKFDGITFGKDRNLLGDEVKRRILLGTYITMKEYHDKWYSSALNARNLIKKEIEEAFEKVDFIINPTMPRSAPRIGEEIDKITEYMMDIGTTFQPLSKTPAISIPFKGIGIQITAPRFKDGELLALAEGLS